MLALLYSNENFPRPTVDELRRLGHDVLTLAETGRAGQAMPDPEVLSFARMSGRTLVTLNRKHFIRLHREQPTHTGIIVCAFDADFVALAQRIDAAIVQAGPLDGLLIRINRPG